MYMNRFKLLYYMDKAIWNYHDKYQSKGSNVSDIRKDQIRKDEFLAYKV